METIFPREGKIIDLGCGNGLFPNILKLKSTNRKITGIDLDYKKIRIAKKTQKDRSAIKFQTGNIVAMNYPVSDIISLIDVLYLIPFETQEIIFLSKLFRESGKYDVPFNS